MPKVSVIVPNFNHANFLEQRLESILSQTEQNFEIILLDDASTDHSAKIIANYAKHPKVSHTIINAQNSGSTFEQWQKGLSLALGEYIWIAESDDVADPNFLKTMLTAMDIDREIGLMYSSSIWIDSQGQAIHTPMHEDSDLLAYGSALITNEFAKGCLVYNASSAVFRKKLVETVDFNLLKGFKYAGDWLFWVQLIKNTKVQRLNKRYNFFRRHSNNVSGNAEQNGLQFSEGFKVLNYIFQQGKLSFYQKQYLLLYWVNKLIMSGLENKRQYLTLLPFQAKLYYYFLKLRHL